MVRVSSFGQQQLLINAIQQNQGRVFEAQRQIATGRETDEFRGIAGETTTLLGSKSFLSRTETYQQTIATISGRLDANAVQISGIADALIQIQESIRTAVANDQAEGLPELIDSTFRFLLNSVNANIDGTFLFAGSRTGTAPVSENIRSIQDLQAFVDPNSDGILDNPVRDIFENSDTAFQARIADGVDLQFGILADDLANDAFSQLQQIWAWHTGVDPASTGPLQGELDDAQFSFLQDQVGILDKIISGIRQIEVQNGLAFERLDVVDQQHKDTELFLQTFISGIEDVDIAEAITRLNNDNFALQASFQSIASLNNLSLLNFL